MVDSFSVVVLVQVGKEFSDIRWNERRTVYYSRGPVGTAGRLKGELTLLMG